MQASDSVTVSLQTFMDDYKALDRQARAANIDRVLLPGLEQHAAAAQALAEHFNLDDLPTEQRAALSITLSERENYDHAIGATDDICKHLHDSLDRYRHLEHLARIRDVDVSKIDSYDQWLADAGDLSARGETMVQQPGVYDCGFTPGKWQEFSGRLLELDTAIGEDTFFLRHGSLHLEPLPHSSPDSEEALEAHASYRQLRDNWHEYILSDGQHQPHPYENVPSGLVKIMRQLSDSTDLPDSARQAVSTLFTDCRSYHHAFSDVETYIQDAGRSLDTNRDFADTIATLDPQKARAEDVDGYVEWQHQAAKLVRAGEEMVSEDSSACALYLKHNPELKDQVESSIDRLKDTLEDALPSRAQEVERRRQVDQHRSISRGMRI